MLKPTFSFWHTAIRYPVFSQNPKSSLKVTVDELNSYMLKYLWNEIFESLFGYMLVLPKYMISENNLPCNRVSIQFIAELAHHDSVNNLKTVPHLYEKVCEPGHFCKIKVNLARNFAL